jgi:hypothetical protein
VRSRLSSVVAGALASWFIFGALAVAAEEPIESHPGYFSLDDLGLVDPALSSVDINLQGSMLRLVGASVLREEPSLAALVSDLIAIRVLVTPANELRPQQVDAAIGRGAAALEKLGWQRVVKVREVDEQVHVYLKEVDGQIEGLTLFVFEPDDELTMINLVGKVDLEQLAAIGQAFDIPTLESALEADREKTPGPDDRR